MCAGASLPLLQLTKMNSILPVRCMLPLMYFIGFKGARYSLRIFASRFYLDSNTDSFLSRVTVGSVWSSCLPRLISFTNMYIVY